MSVNPTLYPVYFTQPGDVTSRVSSPWQVCLGIWDFLDVPGRIALIAFPVCIMLACRRVLLLGHQRIIVQREVAATGVSHLPSVSVGRVGMAVAALLLWTAAFYIFWSTMVDSYFTEFPESYVMFNRYRQLQPEQAGG